jgi:hypothetical protein
MVNFSGKRSEYRVVGYEKKSFSILNYLLVPRHHTAAGVYHFLIFE